MFNVLTLETMHVLELQSIEQLLLLHLLATWICHVAQLVEAWFIPNISTIIQCQTLTARERSTPEQLHALVVHLQILVS